MKWNRKKKGTVLFSLKKGIGLLFLVAANIVPRVPKVGVWVTSIADALKVEDLPAFILLGN